MSLLSLATVELQLIMHNLDKLPLLYLARCSKFTLSSASSDFTWKFLSPLPISLNKSLLHIPRLIPNSLLRYVDVSLHFDLESNFINDFKDEPLFSSISLLKRLRIVIVSDFIHPYKFTRLIECESMRNLKELRAGR